MKSYGLYDPDKPAINCPGCSLDINNRHSYACSICYALLEKDGWNHKRFCECFTNIDEARRFVTEYFGGTAPRPAPVTSPSVAHVTDSWADAWKPTRLPFDESVLARALFDTDTRVDSLIRLHGDCTLRDATGWVTSSAKWREAKELFWEKDADGLRTDCEIRAKEMMALLREVKA